MSFEFSSPDNGYFSRRSFMASAAKSLLGVGCAGFLTNKGLSPYGFLSAGLGACTSMTIRMYARHKGWPLEHVSVDVNHDKVHAQDAKTAVGDKIDTWRRRIRLAGDLSQEQRERLLEIADRCPVHRTLERSSTVITELAD